MHRRVTYRLANRGTYVGEKKASQNPDLEGNGGSTGGAEGDRWLPLFWIFWVTPLVSGNPLFLTDREAWQAGAGSALG